MPDDAPAPKDHLEPGSGTPPPMSQQVLQPATLAVHAGRPPKEPDQPLNEPLTMASTYVAGGEREYGRYGNPTWAAFETALGALEGGRCLAFSSGMAAVTTVLDLVGAGGTVVMPRHAYLGSIGYLADLESRGRASSRLVDVGDPGALEAACEGAALVWLESPSNPTMEVVDLAAVTRVAHAAGAHVVVDNTFATPVLQRPLEHGVDLVVHSATKYLAGHSDALIGALVTRDDELLEVLKKRRDLAGAVPGTLEAWLALRGLRTVHLRVERAQANARTLVERLREHPAVDEVRYPGFGGMIAAVVGSALAGDLLVRQTRLWVHATSLGGVESTLERRRRWSGEPVTVPEGLVRLSVGVEDVEDLWADLSRALDLLV